MSFQAVRAVFETAVIDALAGLATPVPCYVANQAYTVPDAGSEYATADLQFGSTTSKTLGGNLEQLQGSLVVECYTSKNTGPARAQEMITPVMQSLNDLNSCSGYRARGAVGWVGDMTGPAFFALDNAPFYMVRLSVAISARFTDLDLAKRLLDLENTHDAEGGHDSGEYTDLRNRNAELGSPEDFNTRLEVLERNHDAKGGHDSGEYTSKRNRDAESGSPEDFNNRLEELERNHDAQKGHDSGLY